MENFDFDNKFKEGLENINPILNNDEIWDNIEPHLKKKKKRRMILWFFFGIVGILGLTWMQTSYISSDQAKLSKSDIKKEVERTPIAQYENEDILVSEERQDDVETSAVSKVVQDKEIEKQTKANADKSLLNASLPSVQNSINSQPEKAIQVEVKARTSDLQKEIKNKVPKETKAPELIIKNEKKEHSNTEVLTLTEERNRNSIDKKAHPKTSKPTIITEESKVIKEKPNLIHKPLKKEADKSIEIVLPPASKEEVVKKKLTKKERAEANEKRKKERKRKKEEREKKKKEEKEKAKKEKNKLTKPSKSAKWKYQFQMTGSGIYTLHFLRDGNRSESGYLNNRNEFVKGTEGFGTEIRFATEIPSGLILTAGIQYQELHEKLERIETIEESEFQDVTITVTENAQGAIIGSTSSMRLVTTTTTYNQQLYNQYRFINFPIGIGYALKNRGMRLKLLGGLDLNAYYKFSGSLFNRDLSIIKLSSKATRSYDRIYKNTVGFGVWAAVEWHKPMSDRLSLVVAPGIQAPISSISTNNEDWPISQNIVKLKLGVGINYLFDGKKKSKKRTRKGGKD